MKLTATLIGLATILAHASTASAHVVAWQAGETRSQAFGSCAKGPCVKRYNFAASKPHRQTAGRIIFGHAAFRTK